MKELLEITKIVDRYGRPGVFSVLKIEDTAVLDTDYMEENEWDRRLISKIAILGTYIPGFDYRILNSKLDGHLYYNNLMLRTNSKPVVGETLYNYDRLAKHAMSCLLSEATTVQHENLCLSGLSFSIKGKREFNFGADLNAIYKDYLIACKMGFNKNPDVIYMPEEQLKILPFISDMLVSLNHLVDDKLLEYFTTANGPALCLELASILTENDFTDLMDALKDINKYNRLYQADRLSDEELKTACELYNEVEMIIMHTYHSTKTRTLKRS